MSVADLLFTLQVISAAIGVQPQTLKCEADSCAGHAGNTLTLDPSTSVTLWIAPDDEIVTRVPDRNPIACPESNLRATAHCDFRRVEYCSVPCASKDSCYKRLATSCW